MKLLKLVVVVGLVVAGSWFGRTLWAAHHDLVTLHVRNVPLAEVARTIAGQVHQKINVDPKLDAKVTLDVKRLPLTNVLDLLAEQSGARWGKTHAVYDSESALGRLEGALGGSTTLEAAGWTNVAPRFAKLDLPPMDFAGGGSGPRRMIVNGPDGSPGVTGGQPMGSADVQRFPPADVKGGAVTVDTEDVSAGTHPGVRVVRGGGPGPIGGEPNHRVTVRVMKGPGGTTTTTTTTMEGDAERVNVTRSSPDGVVLQQDDWSRERLVMVTPLSERLGDAIPGKATRETAEQAAAKVHGRYTCYYALEKPPLGGDFRAVGEPPKFFGKGGTNDPMAAMEAERKANMFGGLGKLSPEQQVQRARQLRETQDLSK
jgi:hypothetical protein